MSSKEVPGGESSDTRVKRGVPLPNMPVALEEDPSPEAYRRAPTMMLGASAGSRGKVQVWAPDLRRLKWTAVASVGWMVAAVYLGLHFRLLNGLPLAIVSLVGTVQALRRPGYVSTDDAGLAVHTPQGSRTIAWDDVVSLYGTTDATGTLLLRAPDPIPIHLTGYSARRRKELLWMILQRAALAGHPRRRALYVRQNTLPPPAIRIGTLVSSGATLTENSDGRLLVAEVVGQSPAAIADLRSGDEIVEINGWPADSVSEEQANAEMMGSDGAIVYLTIRRTPESRLLPREIRL